ncbi:hypothetical protein BD626DRAFT_458997 [Schizophyllum amplum]|uniref:Uncharacterized protein n=1 Tax=Schizophyllum amplum TaxID=97359 RepID=A0A550CB88_9AGAR|nr:hypothetical protein BD626DRAFT_458997 [Auriculariopsis ampla]
MSTPYPSGALTPSAPPPPNSVPLTPSILRALLTHLDARLPQVFGDRTVTLVVHGGAAILLHPEVALEEQTPRRASTRDVNYLGTTFASEWRGRGVPDAERFLHWAAHEAAARVGVGSDWLNASADTMCPQYTDIEGHLHDPVHEAAMQPHVAESQTLFKGRALVVLGVPSYWAVALKLQRYVNWDPADICLILRYVSNFPWTVDYLEKWLRDNCGQTYPIDSLVPVGEVDTMRARLQHIVQLLRGRSQMPAPTYMTLPVPPVTSATPFPSTTPQNAEPAYVKMPSPLDRLNSTERPRSTQRSSPYAPVPQEAPVIPLYPGDAAMAQGPASTVYGAPQAYPSDADWSVHGTRGRGGTHNEPRDRLHRHGHRRSASPEMEGDYGGGEWMTTMAGQTPLTLPRSLLFPNGRRKERDAGPARGELHGAPASASDLPTPPYSLSSPTPINPARPARYSSPPSHATPSTLFSSPSPTLRNYAPHPHSLRRQAPPESSHIPHTLRGSPATASASSSSSTMFPPWMNIPSSTDSHPSTSAPSSTASPSSMSSPSHRTSAAALRNARLHYGRIPPPP